MSRFGRIVVGAFAVLLAGRGHALAAVFNVASGDTAGLMAAIDTANANGEADTINVAAGTYTALPSSGSILPPITSEIDIVAAGAHPRRSGAIPASCSSAGRW